MRALSCREGLGPTGGIAHDARRVVRLTRWKSAADGEVRMEVRKATLGSEGEEASDG